MHSVSDICDKETSILACFTPNVSANSGLAPKLEMKGLAKPLVICRETPNNIEKMKKMAIFFSLKRENAFKPKASAIDLCSLFLTTGQSGKVKE